MHSNDHVEFTCYKCQSRESKDEHVRLIGHAKNLVLKLQENADNLNIRPKLGFCPWRYRGTNKFLNVTKPSEMAD